MIDINLRFQAVLFGPWEEISPKPDVLTYFINEFSDKELIPTNFQEFTPIGLVNRLSLMSSDDLWKIDFTSNRIDIVKNNLAVDSSDFGDLRTFVSEAIKIIEKILKRYPKKSNRISLISTYLLKEMDIERINEVYYKLFNTIKLYKNNPVANWRNRTVARINKKILDKTELLNVISDVAYSKKTLKEDGVNKNFERIELKFDNNTYQGNTEYRFGLDEIKSFYEVALLSEHDLVKSYLKLINS